MRVNQAAGKRVVRALKVTLALALATASIVPLCVSAAKTPAANAAPASDETLRLRLAAGVKAFTTGDPKAALGLLNAGLALAKKAGKTHFEAAFLANIGAIEDRLGAYPAALQTDLEALRLATQVRDGDIAANVLDEIGLVEQFEGHYPEALQTLQQGLAIAQQVGDQDLMAKCLANMGFTDANLGRYSDALESLKRSLELARQQGDQPTEAVALDNVGLVDAGLGRFPDALQSLRQSLALARQLNDVGTQATALTNIGFSEQNLGRYAEALRTYQQALTLAQQTGNRSMEAVTLGNIGLGQAALGRYDDALKTFEQSRELAHQMGAQSIEATEFESIGSIKLILGNPAEALPAFQQALTVARQAGNLQGEAVALISIGGEEARDQHYADALQSDQQALAVVRQLGDRNAEATFLVSTGFAQEGLGLHTDALKSARDSALLQKQLGTPEWASLSIAATAEAKLDRVTDALADYESAVTNIEQLRAEISEKSEQSSFFGTVLFVYTEYIKYLLDLNRRFPDKGYDRKALEIFERQQARTFLEEIAESAAHRFAGVPAEVSDQEQAFAVQLSQLQTSLASARSSAKPEPAQIASLQSERANVVSQKSTLEAKIQASYPAYYALLHPTPLVAQAQDPGQLSIAGFQQTILRPNEALLVYDALDDRTALWVISSKALHLVVLADGAKPIESKLAAFTGYRTQMQQSTANSTLPYLGGYSQSHLAPVTAASQDLYDLLMPPGIRPFIADATTLFIVPSGPLYGFPFETLVTQAPASAKTRPRYLIEDKAVSYLSSASLLAVLRSGVEKQQPASNPLLAFANPVYTGSVASPVSTAAPAADLGQLEVAAIGAKSRAYSPESGFASLPGTDDEAQAIFAALSLSPSGATLHEGEDASVATIEGLNESGALKNYQYIFFGAHAVLPDEVKGLTQSSLVLSHPPAGFLTMGDVFGLSLDARAVILSACDSAGGTVTSGEGVQGLTQAFMYAGTPIVSVTDWEVIDQLQPEFNKVFFSALAGGKTAAQALRRAKLKMLADDNPDDVSRTQPYFWAPTVIFGDGDSR